MRLNNILNVLEYRNEAGLIVYLMGETATGHTVFPQYQNQSIFEVLVVSVMLLRYFNNL